MKPYYESGGITIYHGDCREVVKDLRLTADLILTDPPYGLGRRLNGGTWGASGRGYSWDQEAPDLSELLKAGRHAIVWGGNYFPLPPSRCWFVWRKPDAVRTMADVDLAWTSFNKPSRLFSYSIAATNKERGDHPTPKPLALMTWCIGESEEVGTVLDPFMGSGTTLRAAKDLGKKAVGIEIEEKYCEVAVRRLAQGVLFGA